jgi:hypothetical protein
MTTFEVDSVEEAREAPTTVALGTLVQDTLWMAPGPQTRVVDPKGTHPLLAAVHQAFAEHRPLVLSPDAVWLTLAQGVAQHVRLNAASLRSRLVRHEGRRALRVEVLELPGDEAGFQQLFSAFRDQLREALGPGLPRLLSCDFSTSTPIERMAGDVVLMDAVSPYFDYILFCGCGIPRVTLLGTPEDWRAIRRRIDVIAELDLGWWTSSLIPIADEFVRASEGRPDRELWKELYKPRDAYLWDRASGWVLRLFPYVKGAGRFNTRNPMLERTHTEQMAAHQKAEGQSFDFTGLALHEVPASLSAVPLQVEDASRGTRDTWSLEAGVLAVEVDAAGALVPRAGVAVKRGAAPVMEVVERILAGHAAPPASGGGAYHGQAELNALYDHLQEATLFPGTRPWRLRPSQEHEEVHVLLEGGGVTPVYCLADLPDGTVLALRRHSSRGHFGVIVRLRASELRPAPPPPDVERQPWDEESGWPVWLSHEGAARIPVVGTSLVALLAQALDSGGATELPVLGTLEEELEPWEKRAVRG